ncbi:hypothetical protein TNCV_1145171 [Trichonephila clavipes]|nr:hypothetical protein TNCV_1145171 [Trichonephila clavipes]
MGAWGGCPEARDPNKLDLTMFTVLETKLEAFNLSSQVDFDASDDEDIDIESPEVDPGPSSVQARMERESANITSPSLVRILKPSHRVNLYIVLNF